MSTSDNVIILDVREPHETMGPLGKIHGSVNIPLAALRQGVSYLNLDPDTTIIVLCRTQNRSSEAYTELVRMGYTDVYILMGGMMEYAQGR